MVVFAVAVAVAVMVVVAVEVGVVVVFAVGGGVGGAVEVEVEVGVGDVAGVVVERMINPWQTLNVHRQSSDGDVRSAYIRLAQKYHPDRGGDATKFAQISEAYRLLADRQRKSIFIKNLLVRNRECRACKGVGVFFSQKGLTKKIASPCKVCGGAGVFIKENT